VGCKGCRRGDQESADGENAAQQYVAVDPLSLAGAAAELTTNATVSCGRGDAKEVMLPDGTIVELDEETEMVINSIAETDGQWNVSLELNYGAIRLEVPPADGKELEVHTPVATAGVRGTEFAVSHSEDDGTEVSVFSGEVVASNADDKVTLTDDRAAVLTQRAVRRERIRNEVHERWQVARTRIADKLIERFGIDIEGDETPDLNEVLQRVPEAARKRMRERLEERIAVRRGELQAVLLDIADTIDRRTMTAQERFAAARENWIEMDDARRGNFRQNVETAQQRYRDNLEQLADTMARLGADTAASRLREAAERSNENMRRLSDTIARTSYVIPEFTVTIGDAEGAEDSNGDRRLLAKPAPALPGTHPFIQEVHTFRYRVKIGAGGAVQEARYVTGTMRRDEVEQLGRLLRAWRFNAVLRRGTEQRTITITTVPQD